jgi:hypothetical protein
MFNATQLKLHACLLNKTRSSRKSQLLISHDQVNFLHGRCSSRKRMMALTYYPVDPCMQPCIPLYFSFPSLFSCICNISHITMYKARSGGTYGAKLAEAYRVHTYIVEMPARFCESPTFSLFIISSSNFCFKN